MMRKTHTFRNIILPIMLLLPLIWMMTGCLYIPFFEHRLDRGPNPRAMIGDTGSGRLIAPGRITRQQVIAILGEAPLVSDDGTAVGYIETTSVGSWVWPLCFAAKPADARTYIVRLVFDSNGYLNRYDWTDAGEFIFPVRIGGFGYVSGNAAFEKMNKSEPQLRYASEEKPSHPATTDPIDLNKLEH